LTEVCYCSNTAGLAAIREDGAQQSLVIKISFDDPRLNPPGPFSESFSSYANVDILANALANDSVESPKTVWIPGVTLGSYPWQRVPISQAPLN
jgi:hypothetical protein